MTQPLRLWATIPDWVGWRRKRHYRPHNREGPRLNLIDRLNTTKLGDRLSQYVNSDNTDCLRETLNSGVMLLSTSNRLENRFCEALGELLASIHTPETWSHPILYEGRDYAGCWLEGTGTISAERLAQLAPQTAEQTFLSFSHLQRSDGLIPFCIGDKAIGYFHVQAVSSLARSVWNHYRLNGARLSFLQQMYAAMATYDDWIARYRNTRGTGAVEAFCAWDTGHDMSPRFWHVPDCTPHRNPTECWDLPQLPYLAPDLTAFVYAQRKYLSKIARALGRVSEAQQWHKKSEETYRALWAQCFDPTDACFYDRDAQGGLVRIPSDILLRVLANEAADGAYMRIALAKYLLNTKKFYARYPLTSLAIDDPRFDHNFSHNTWGGATNFLSLLRAPDAFEYYGHYAELTGVMQPAVYALVRGSDFSQTMNPWTGVMGFGSQYSPAMLTLIDFVGRLCGVLPTPDSELWFSALTLLPYEGGDGESPDTAYRRIVDQVTFDLHIRAALGQADIRQDGVGRYQFPVGLRLVTDRSGDLRAIIGLSHRPVAGRISMNGGSLEFAIQPNEIQRFDGKRFVSASNPGYIMATGE